MSTQKNTPVLRFPEFQNDWKKLKFDRHCIFQQGVQVDVELQKKEPQEGYSKFLRIENYTQKSVDFRYVPDVYSKKKHISKDDIVVVRYGATAGYIGRGFEGILANNLFKIIPDEEVFELEYLFHFLKSYKAFHFFQSEMSGGAMPALSFGIVKALKIPITHKLEQQKIASFLTAVDTKIEQLTKKKNLLEQYKKGVMQQIFSQAIRFKDDNGNDYPDWEEKKLCEVGKFRSGVGFSNKEQGRKVGVPFYKVSDMNLKGNETIMTRSNNYVSDEQIKRLRYKVIKEFSMIFAKVGAAIYLERKRVASNFLIDNNMMAFSPDESAYFYKYLFETIRLSKYAQVGALPSYNASDLETIKIEMPCSEEQAKIANFLSAIDDKIELVNTQLENIQQFKKGLLQQMFV